MKHLKIERREIWMKKETEKSEERKDPNVGRRDKIFENEGE